MLTLGAEPTRTEPNRAGPLKLRLPPASIFPPPQLPISFLPDGWLAGWLTGWLFPLIWLTQILNFPPTVKQDLFTFKVIIVVSVAAIWQLVKNWLGRNDGNHILRQYSPRISNIPSDETSKYLNIHVFGNVNVLGMTLKIFLFVQGTHRTPLLFILRYSKTIIL